MTIKRRYIPALVGAGVGVGLGLALLLALFVGVGTAHAVWCTEDGDRCCDRPLSPLAMDFPMPLCDGPVTCWGPDIEDTFGCDRVRFWLVDPGQCCISQFPSQYCAFDTACVRPESPVPETGGSIWLADVCEPDDGFSANGEMTIDSNFPGPLKFGASFDGPWVEVVVSGPPWVVTEEMLEAFAEMVGVEDWHDLWVRSGDGYPQYLGNMIIERDGRMDLLCAE
jgi:hypothetical protein